MKCRFCMSPAAIAVQYDCGDTCGDTQVGCRRHPMEYVCVYCHYILRIFVDGHLHSMRAETPLVCRDKDEMEAAVAEAKRLFGLDG